MAFFTAGPAPSSSLPPRTHLVASPLGMCHPDAVRHHWDSAQLIAATPSPRSPAMASWEKGGREESGRSWKESGRGEDAEEEEAKVGNNLAEEEEEKYTLELSLRRIAMTRRPRSQLMRRTKQARAVAQWSMRGRSCCQKMRRPRFILMQKSPMALNKLIY